jgi:hypothetical protein
MEIKDYLRAIRRWLWMPIVLPLVAGAGTGVLLLKQPLQYQADATVVVPAVSARGFSTSAAAQYVATFKDVLISAPLVSEVSKATGVPTKDLVSGLTASTVTASSNIIHVVYIGYQKNNATAVVRLATRDTLDIVAQPQLQQAQAAVASSSAQLKAADDAINAFTNSSGQVQPDVAFRTKQAELLSLQLQLQQTQIAGDAPRAALLQAVITQREAELSQLAAQLSQYTSLTQARQQAVTVASHDQQLLGDAQALLSADHLTSTVFVTDIGKLSRSGNILKFSAIAAAVALIMALALILLMELMRYRRPAVAGPAAGSGGQPLPPTPAGTVAAPLTATDAVPTSNGAHLNADDPDAERDLVTSAGPTARR